MSLIQTVAALIEQHKTGTADTLLPHCEGCELWQVARALHNASRQGLVRLTGRAGPEAGKRTRLGTFAPGPAPGKPEVKRSKRPAHRGVLPKVSSVWELGAMASQ